MWFNSFSFWIFLTAVMGVYFRLNHRARNRFLLVASYFFYGCWDWRFLFLILFTSGFDYFVARRIWETKSKKQRKAWLTASVCVDLTILGVFKYFGFFVSEANRFLSQLGFENWGLGLEIILPVGISFYTFQALSYTVDVYRGKTRPCNQFLDFALYIAFFPQLVAGPIERSTQLLPQVEQSRPPLNADRFREGLFHILTGLFRKVVIADNMAWLANYIFSKPTDQMTGAEILVGIYAFSLQIYGDFSGYSSIAIGVAKWLGFDLMENFRHPYFATNPREFWQRWHISLSSWLRDYLYIPLGGNRGNRWLTNRNLLITMLLGGLWHGAAWTFIVWGAIHGLWLVLHRAWERTGVRNKLVTNLPAVFTRAFALVITFHIVCLTWVFFRAESFTQAISLLEVIGSSNWQMTSFVTTGLTLIAFFFGPWLAYEMWVEKMSDPLAMTRVSWLIRTIFYLYIILMMLFFPAPFAAEFIYFQF